MEGPDDTGLQKMAASMYHHELSAAFVAKRAAKIAHREYGGLT